MGLPEGGAAPGQRGRRLPGPGAGGQVQGCWVSFGFEPRALFTEPGRVGGGGWALESEFEKPRGVVPAGVARAGAQRQQL